MWKFLLYLVIAFALGMTFPQSREIIMDVSEPVREAVANPFRAWVTRNEMAQIVTDLERHEDTRGNLPMARGQFDRWLDDRYQQESSRVDAWGTRYAMEVRGDVIRVLSAGPDGAFGTDDDLVKEGLRARARRR
jgi:hypothetical protein